MSIRERLEREIEKFKQTRGSMPVGVNELLLNDALEEIKRLTASEIQRLSPPTEEEIAAYRNLFRAELDKNMHNSSASPSTDAHRVALHKFVEGRNVQR
jgi:hypothetical protein